MKKEAIVLGLLLVAAGGLFVLNKRADQKRWENQLIKDQQWFESNPLIEKIEPYPIKTAAYWTSPTMDSIEVLALARHDLVIADLENAHNNRISLLQLKRLNPDLKLLAYSNPMEIWTTTYQNRPWQNKVINEIANNRPQWLLKAFVEKKVKRQDQEYTAFEYNYAVSWDNMVMVNLSSSCPRIKGETYNEWMAKKISQEILPDPIWDGYFQDNGAINISWIYSETGQKIDINDDGKLDYDYFMDKAWKQGVENYLSIIQRKLDSLARVTTTVKEDFLIITNKGDTNLLQFVDGKFFENFPNDYLGDKWANGWQQCLDNARLTGPFTVFQVDRANIDFGLASSLLFDNIYFAISQDDAGVFPQLYLDLGNPVGPAQKIGTIFVRQFDNYVVRVDPLNQFGEIIPAQLYAGEEANPKNQPDNALAQSETADRQEAG